MQIHLFWGSASLGRQLHDYDPTATGQYLHLQIAIMMMMMLIVVIIIIVRSHLGSSVRVPCEVRAAVV